MRLASWNVSGFKKAKSLKQYDYEDSTNVDYFLKVLKTVNPDILLIQESLVNDKHSFAKELGDNLEMPYFHDTKGTKSFINSDYLEAISIISKVELIKVGEIEHVNPHWEITMANGYLAKSYDRSYQISETTYGKIVHVHYLPEKLFMKSYLGKDGIEYITENLEMLNTLKSSYFFCGDLNTQYISEVFEEFFAKNCLTNAFKNTPTRPLLNGTVLPQDVICYPHNEYKLVNRGVEITKTDHYLIWADFEKI